jgi:hypothetical protein
MDIAPDLMHPVREKSIREMARVCDQGGIKEFVKQGGRSSALPKE